jgi:hypothetical protein
VQGAGWATNKLNENIASVERALGHKLHCRARISEPSLECAGNPSPEQQR